MKSVKDLDLEGKRVLVRVDYNLPLDEHQVITDDNRIKATLPLIRYLLEHDTRIILISHMGRPRGKRVPELSLAPAARRLEALLSHPVTFVNDCIGPEVHAAVEKMVPGDIVLLENLRFHGEEQANDPEFAKQFAALCDCFVNEAFSVSHRTQASVVGISRVVKMSGAGFLLEKEIACYRNSVEAPKRPLTAVVGGAKVSSKLSALNNLINHVDTLIIGGAMANTFLKSRGIDVGASMVEDELVATAGEILKKAAEKKVNCLLPVDVVIAETFDKNAEKKIVSVENIPRQWMVMDIGPETTAAFSRAVETSATIVWNGPMGVFEMERFRSGTCGVAQAIAASRGFCVVGGGDTGLAVNVCRVTEKMDYISTGGGAFLYLMEGRTLPGVTALEKLDKI
ncbi:phosphoglycerate kinase [Desulfocicer vacuolatum DSM 3385]|uniref:Phosphoglycerate kinase n=1 Tax=Desulfocicer vacuolatum DSM 3385 TaxID=1121400 RepID=A0A1W1YJB8_9BACT|nr:phosphoglycerate kinase [Desulfocicer vacuolatum]SMC36222.1 phosphoglycerate kinase [Desulfocicer vacuolatum DSM 3385]